LSRKNSLHSAVKSTLHILDKVTLKELYNQAGAILLSKVVFKAALSLGIYLDYSNLVETEYWSGERDHRLVIHLEESTCRNLLETEYQTSERGHRLMIQAVNNPAGTQLAAPGKE